MEFFKASGGFAISDVTVPISDDIVLTPYAGVKTIKADTNAKDIDITLHSATGWDGELYILKTNASYTVTIIGTVNGVVNPTLTSLYEGMRIISDGAGNFISPDFILP